MNGTHFTYFIMDTLTNNMYKDSNHTICRFVTSWATTKEEIAELEKVVYNK